MKLAPLIRWTAERYGLDVTEIEWESCEQGYTGHLVTVKIDGTAYQIILPFDVTGGEIIEELLRQLPRKESIEHGNTSRDREQNENLRRDPRRTARPRAGTQRRD